ncbi:MAG: nucleotidyltransferase domain-containing protein [Armatimonadota bacterium]
MSGAGYGLTEEEKAELWRLISSTISTEGREFFVFGSRAQNHAARFSDVDLGVDGRSLSSLERTNLEEAFEQSNFPYIVDLVEVEDMGDRFREIALRTRFFLGEVNEQVA